MTTWIRHPGSIVDPTAAPALDGDHRRHMVNPVRRNRPARTFHYQVLVVGLNGEELATIRRAIDRLQETGRLVTDVEAEPVDDGLAVTIALRRPGHRAVREAERVFAVLWYDAFGVREVAHSGRLIQ